MMAYLVAKKSRMPQNVEEKKQSTSFLLAKLRQSREYQNWLRDYKDLVRTYNSDVRGFESRQAHRDASPTEEW